MKVDVLIVGAGPVGLLCAFLARKCGLTVWIADKSSGPLRTGRADALNARSLQLLELAGLFPALYPLGKPCNTSSVWADGRFVSRQSEWWEGLQGCFHKHFLMLGQAAIEQLLDREIADMNAAVQRDTSIRDIRFTRDGCLASLSSGQAIESRFIIGADGSRSFVRSSFDIPFQITRPRLTWAVLDGVIHTDFPKVPEIIVFQADTSDVAWIPREGEIDRFYVRMDRDTFSIDEAVAKINRAMCPHTLRFTRIEWFSQFSVKESVAESYAVRDRVYLVGDACHVHSVNGGMGLNTGLADAFNLIWKIHQVVRFSSAAALLQTYQQERQPVALGVVETSAALVRSTAHSAQGTHASDYVRLVERNAGYITGMGVRYAECGIDGSRLFDFTVCMPDGLLHGNSLPARTRIYALLDYRFFTLIVFGDAEVPLSLPSFVRRIKIHDTPQGEFARTDDCPYRDQILLVRPDSYIACSANASDSSPIARYLESLQPNPVADGRPFDIQPS